MFSLFQFKFASPPFHFLSPTCSFGFAKAVLCLNVVLRFPSSSERSRRSGGRQVEDSQTVRPFTHICFRMLAIYGARLTTFEDSEKESEHGYVRKAILTCIPIKVMALLALWLLETGEGKENTISLKLLLSYLSLGSLAFVKGIELVLGTRVKSGDVKRKTLLTVAGETISYKILIIATGARWVVCSLQRLQTSMKIITDQKE
ncbi:hypothetical protein K1719_047548 [Acacia pycnantha]|nr:hypothetical protein K1719_047548 [Acacia pycnantha]